MFKWVLVIALAASIAFCAVMEFRSRQTLGDSQKEIASKRAEIVPLQSFVNEVSAYQVKKDALQKRIDVINQLKTQQRGPAAALEKLADVDPDGVESIAVVGKELVVNRR